ncbi:MAG: deoxyguanosinetriphosphate triphosphohydrolase [Candidatus Omnitrophica bacterium]|nr:deoxyguanosinetriphosphate triphosphohydrolase [Candidatus Omnitrophota bacterium]
MYEDLEDTLLAPYAMRSSQSYGRTHPEKEHELRTAFQRDRDRIVHCTAFRRLEYKTQVFVNHEGDHYRTRLTHTLETCQIARTIARALRLNEDLVEAVSLAHDLGHGPFGHAGEDVLAQLMKGHGGFEHNTQALRIVEKLEESYPGFPGLNLTYETREGLKKHVDPSGGTYGRRYRTLEADLVDFADEIAYTSHDLDDGLRGDLITEDEVEKIYLWHHASSYIRRKYASIQPVQKRRLIIRLIINRLVMDLIHHSRYQVERLRIQSVHDLRKIHKPILGFSKEIDRHHRELKDFLVQNVYQHYRVVRMTDKGQRFLKSLFEVYLKKPQVLPPDVQKRARQDGIHRAVCDYLAGMTDRFALDEFQRFFEPYERV